MNFFESLYCALYYGRIKEGQTVSGSPFTANIVVTVCLTMVVMSIVMMFYFVVPSLGELFQGFLKDVFGRTSGRLIGRILGLVVIGLIYPIIRYTIGTDENYTQIIRQFDEKEEGEKAKIVSKGTKFMYVCLCSIVIPMLIGLVQP